VRLAFGVAAHLEPEILIVDEVLAVGDAEFQKKCLGKMDEVSRQGGRTVLLVSHNMSAVSSLAGRALLLDRGAIVQDGRASEVISAYLSKDGRECVYEATQAPASPHVSRIEVRTSDRLGIHQFGHALEIKFQISHQRAMARGCFSFQVINEQQQPIIHEEIYYPHERFGYVPGSTLLTCRFPSLRLNIGQYYLRTCLSEPPGGGLYESLDNVAHFEVVRSDPASPWGWRQDACAYFEERSWDAVKLAARAVMTVE